MNQQVPGTLFDFRVKLTAAFVLVTLGLVVAALYLLVPHIRPELTYLTALLGGLAVVYSAYYFALILRGEFLCQ